MITELAYLLMGYCVDYANSKACAGVMVIAKLSTVIDRLSNRMCDRW